CHEEWKSARLQLGPAACCSAQCRKSVADSTPTQLPFSSTTGAPRTWCRDSKRAAVCSDISRGISSRSVDIRSSAVRAKRGLVVIAIAYLLPPGFLVGASNRKCRARRPRTAAENGGTHNTTYFPWKNCVPPLDKRVAGLRTSDDNCQDGVRNW